MDGVVSQTTVLGTCVAGYESQITITAKDSAGNLRNIQDGDLFNMTLSKSGEVILGTVKQNPNKLEQYFASFSTDVIGTYALKITFWVSASGNTDGYYSTLVSQSVVVKAGVINSLKIVAPTSINEKESMSFIVQAMDVLGNVIEDTYGGYNVSTSGNSTTVWLVNATQLYVFQVLSINGAISTFYQSAYCAAKSKLCKTASTSTTVLSRFAGLAVYSNGTSDITDTEKPYLSAGFFRLSPDAPSVSNVPGYSTLSYANFTIMVHRCDGSSVPKGATLAGLIGNGTCTFVQNCTLSAKNTGSTSTQNDVNYAAVVGAACGMFFCGSVGYGAFRLSRYRPKYISEKKKADEMEQVLDEMNAEQGLPGARDYAAVGAGFTTRNPLHEANKMNREQMEDFHNDLNPLRAEGGNGDAHSRAHSRASSVELEHENAGPSGPSYKATKGLLA